MNKERNLIEQIIANQEKIKLQSVVKPVEKTKPEEKKFVYTPPKETPKTKA